MTEFTRRETIKLLGGAASISLLPFAASSAPLDLLGLRNRVQSLIDDADLANEIKQYPAQYRKFCKEVPVLHSECKDCAAKLREGVTSLSLVNGEERWRFHTKHQSVELAFIADDVSPDDFPATLRGLMMAFKEKREFEAADLLNTGWIYNPEIGADGQALFSDHHPHDTGVWSNTLQAPLSERALLDALIGVRTNAVDGRGDRIVSRGELLIVPVAQMAVADRLVKTELRPGSAMSDHNIDALHTLPGGIRGYEVNDYLADNDNWFVKASIPGIIMSEYQPFTVTAEIDADSKKVVVVGREIRGFGYTDPRAMFGIRGKEAAAA